jgi:hypothetical protein
VAKPQAPQRQKRGTNRRTVILLGVLGLVVIAVVGLGLYAYTSLTSARDDLNRATTDASELRDALTTGDQAEARGQLQQLQGNVHSAESSLDNPVLSVAAKLPIAGKNVKAVRTITSSIASVADDGLPPLVEVADKFNAKTFNPKDGRIDVASMTALTPNLTAASDVIDQANTDIQAIEASTLLSQLRGPVTDAQSKIGDAADAAARATKASRVVPQMLSGKHTYLLVFQNNAEIRATGGLPGAFARLEIDNGKIELSGQAAGSSIPELSEAVLPLTEQELALFDNKMATFFIDSNFTPDFPRAAQIQYAIIKQELGYDVDGVLSLDPVTLSYLLKGIGPVSIEDGTELTAENAVDVLLNGVYVNYPQPDAQDAVFASATEKVFDKVLSGAGDPTSLLKALAKATNERRVSLWSKDPTIAKELTGTPLAHALPKGDTASPALGFYLNDATGAKMQYYLSYDVTGEATKCTAAGAQTYTSEMTLKSSAPADSATLPESIRGPGFGAEPGSMLMNLYLYGTNAGAINSVTIDGEETTFTEGTHEGRPVAIVTIQVDPGQTVTVQSKLTSGPGQKGATVVDSTPSIVPGKSTQTWKSAC